MKRPNILLLMTDQQARCAQSATGNPNLRTPQMDAISNAGVRFDRAYCTSPVCGPARHSINTGLMPHQTGVLVNDMAPRAGLTNICQLFDAAGYKTAWTGHWNDGPSPAVNGFEVIGGHGPASHLGVHTDQPKADAAIEFISRKHERPFFLAVPFENPHDICFWSMGELEPNAVDRPRPELPDNFAIAADEPEFIQRCRQRTYYGPEVSCTSSWSIEDWRCYLREYYWLVEHIDIQIGRVMSALRDNALDTETLVLFTCDHGEGVAAHHWVSKLMLYDNPVSIPLSISWPGVIDPRVDSHHLVSGVDLLPTLCDYAQIDPPPGLAGRSLRPVMEDGEAKGRSFVVSQLHPDPHDLRFSGRMLRTERFKYLSFSEGKNPELLFDMEDDPGECTNLVGCPEYLETLHTHRNLLQEWMRETGDTFFRPGRDD